MPTYRRGGEGRGAEIETKQTNTNTNNMKRLCPNPLSVLGHSTKAVLCKTLASSSLSRSLSLTLTLFHIHTHAHARRLSLSLSSRSLSFSLALALSHIRTHAHTSRNLHGRYEASQDTEGGGAMYRRGREGGRPNRNETNKHEHEQHKTT